MSRRVRASVNGEAVPPRLRVVPLAATPNARAQAVRELASKALGSGESGILHGMLSTVSSDLACLAELSFDRDRHVSAALTRIHERIEAVLELAVLLGETEPDQAAAE